MTKDQIQDLINETHDTMVELQLSKIPQVSTFSTTMLDYLSMAAPRNLLDTLTWREGYSNDTTEAVVLAESAKVPPLDVAEPDLVTFYALKDKLIQILESIKSLTNT